MQIEKIPTEFKKAIEDLGQGHITIEIFVRDAIEKASNWKEAQENIASHMDSYIQEAQGIKVNLCGAEEVILEGWCIEDIKGKAIEGGNKISDEQAISILERLSHNFDASIGINWDVIDSAIDEEIK